MCTGLEVAAVASLLGAGATAWGAKEQGKFQENLASRNAAQAELEGAEVKKQGLQEEEQHRLKVKRIIGAQRAILGASNVDVNTGSAGDVQGDAALYGELDAQTIRSNAFRRAWGLETQATNDRLQGRMAKQAGTMSAFSTILAGGSRAYGIYKGK